jgi:hypothetical protein
MPRKVPQVTALMPHRKLPGMLVKNIPEKIPKGVKLAKNINKEMSCFWDQFCLEITLKNTKGSMIL